MNLVLKTFLISQLRRISYKWPAFGATKMNARIGKAINPATGRAQWRTRCELCNYEFFETSTEVDHKDPVVPIAGWDSFDGYVARLFCGPEDLQVVCKPCHRAKTHKENQGRKR
jgi:5-methylcytosine-specific restriction endonuclease McrA